MADYREQATALASRYGIPAPLFLSLIQVESRGNPGALSPAGAIGYTQLMPGTARGLGVDPYDPVQNLTGGAKYLSDQYKTFGSWPLALAAYNAGPGAVSKYGGIPPYAETQRYVRNVMQNGGSGPALSPAGVSNAPSRLRREPGLPPPSIATAGPDRDPAEFLQQAISALGDDAGPAGFYRKLMSAQLARRRRPEPEPVLADEPAAAPTTVTPPATKGRPDFGEQQEQSGKVSPAMLTFAKHYGLTITPQGGFRDPATNRGVGGAKASYHLRGLAADVVPDAAARKAYKFALANPDLFAEAFYDPMGAYVKNGRIVKGAIGGHSDHIHFVLR